MKIGFQKAMSAILDGNITTLIASVVLMALGSGTVKGFAYTLMIINTITIARPIAPAFKLVEIAWLPNCAPTTEDSNSESCKEREPIRICVASVSASSKSAIPVICASPPVIAVCTRG
jgi:hypothetical protein